MKVLDFGISKTLDKSFGVDGLSLTRTEMLLGSPLYMSPEQMRSSKNVDERSDSGRSASSRYELLTGRVPFEADSILELCFKVAQESAPNAKEVRADLPDELCAAVAKCLEKDPGDRFANVGELAQAFEPFALPRDRGTAERALDVLGTGKRPPQRTPSLTNEVAQTAAAVVAVPASDPPAAPVPVLAQSTPSSPDPVAPAAWGTTQAHTASKSRKGMVALAAAVVAIAAVAGTLVASRTGRTEGAAAGPAAVAPMGLVGAASGGTADTQPSAKSSVTEPVASPRVAADAATEPVAVVASAVAAPAVKPAVRPQAAATTSKPVKPAASAAKAEPPVDQGGFIKVRE